MSLGQLISETSTHEHPPMRWLPRSLCKAPATRDVPPRRTLSEGMTFRGVWWWCAERLLRCPFYVSFYDEAISTSTSPPLCTNSQERHPCINILTRIPSPLHVGIIRHQLLTMLSVFSKSEVFWMLKVIKSKIGSRKQRTDKSSLWQPGTKWKTRQRLWEANTSSIPKLMLHVRYALKRGYFS